MPLFDNIENDVTTFFVSQGSVFDTLIRSFMDRMAMMETRVETLTGDVTTKFHSMHQLITNTAETTAALSAAAAASATTASEQAVVPPTANAMTEPDSKELEYYIMTISRQLNVVLELFFRSNDVADVSKIHEQQARFQSISDVLTENEAILMQLESDEAKFLVRAGSHRQVNDDVDGDDAYEKQEQEVNESRSTTILTETMAQTHEENEEVESRLNESDIDAQIAQLSGFNSNTAPSEEVAASAMTTITSERPSKKTSLFVACRELQLAEDARRREAQLKDAKLLKQMQLLLQNARTQWHTEVLAVCDLQMNELRRQQQQYTSLELFKQQEQQQRDLEQQLQELSASMLICQTGQQQQLVDLLAQINNLPNHFASKTSFDAFATTDFVSKHELDDIATKWLQNARDHCDFGANATTLEALKQDLLQFQIQLIAQQQQPVNPDTPSLEITKLLEETSQILQLLMELLALLNQDVDALHSDRGAEMLLTVRNLLTQLDNLSQRVELDQESTQQSTSFLTNTLQQMEQGTANLLEAFETQQEKYEQVFARQQAAIDQLHRELHERKADELELRKQLMACPSQEDTMRIIQELSDQINAKANDSTTRMLATVDDLRAKLSGLTTADVIDRLTKVVQTKVDRSEIDRLQKNILEATNHSGVPTTPMGAVMKSPMRCLACDQTVPYGFPGGPSSPEHDTSSHGTAAFGAHALNGHHTNHNLHHNHQIPDQPPNPAADKQLPSLFMQQFGDLDVFGEFSFPSSTTAASKRRKHRQEVALRIFNQNNNNWAGVGVKHAFVNLDGGRNRIPLRKTLLSDQVVYGPSITPNTFKKKPLSNSNRSEDSIASRPKTAFLPDRRSEIITRSVSSTVIVRPFAELTQDSTLKRNEKRL